MKRKVEVQAIIQEPKEAERALHRVGRYIETKKQIDKYFVPPHKDFFVQDPPVEYLRIRYEGKTNYLRYSFLHFDKRNDLVVTDEYESLVESPIIIEQIFRKIGLIHKVTVIKTRKCFDCDNFNLTLDKVEELGNFIEVEAKRIRGTVEETKKECLNFLNGLHIHYEIKPKIGYPRMLCR